MDGDPGFVSMTNNLGILKEYIYIYIYIYTYIYIIRRRSIALIFESKRETKYEYE